MMNFKPPPKRKKLDPQTSFSPGAPYTEIRDAEFNALRKSMVHESPSATMSVRIQQARNYAVAEARQDGCTANYKVFDSPFGNYLVPITPTRAQLGG